MSGYPDRDGMTWTINGYMPKHPWGGKCICSLDYFKHFKREPNCPVHPQTPIAAILSDPDWVMWLKKLGQGKGYGKSSDSLNYKHHDGFIEQGGPGWIEFVEIKK